MRNQIATLMTHVQMVDHRVEIARIEQKELGEEVQSKMQGIQVTHCPRLPTAL